MVSASYELVKTSSKKNDSRSFLQRYEIFRVIFLSTRCDIIPLAGNRDRYIGEAYELTPEIQTAFADTK